MNSPPNRERPHKLAESSVVFLGAFNPAIYQPAWFVQHELIAENPDGTELDVASPQVTAFRSDWLRLLVQLDRLEFHASDEVTSPKLLLDLVLSVFDLLPHVPISAFGINRSVHFGVESREAFDAIGYHLFSRDAWQGALDDPRMRTVQIEQRHGDMEKPEWITTVTVQPSGQDPQAVFVAVNDHFPFYDGSLDGIETTAKLVEVFDDRLAAAAALIDHVRAL